MRRFSIRTMMAVIVISAVGLAAIRNCSAVWAGAMLSITFFTLICSLLGVIFGRNIAPDLLVWFRRSGLGLSFAALCPVALRQGGGISPGPKLVRVSRGNYSGQFPGGRLTEPADRNDWRRRDRRRIQRPDRDRCNVGLRSDRRGDGGPTLGGTRRLRGMLFRVRTGW